MAKRHFSLVTHGFVVLGLWAGLADAQSTVNGQVSIAERPGGRTDDLANVVVYLEPTGPRPKPGSAAAVVTLQGRQFSPRIRVVTAGSTVAFTNQDAFNHNVFSKATHGPFDTQSYGRGKAREHVFRAPGVYPIYCNVHPRMTGYVIAVSTPYHAQAGADGRFTIADVPPGSYRMTIWHDRAAPQSATITVDAGGAAGLRYQLDARTYHFVQHKNKFGRDYTSGGDVY
ncbi:MAG: carboxypeptidase regulatory-like domain-containing protein [Gemmatimonadaceae bacterium]|nr:carboxypeptidase regulatory-like domain-containing protein [Gemmatimonadaceae bacterium]